MKKEKRQPKMQNFENAVLATLAYGDALAMPLTAMEVWRGLIRVPIDAAQGKQGTGDGTKNVSDFSEIFQILQSLKEAGKISEQWGFYVLPGRETLVKERLWRMRVADEKWKKLLRVACWMRFVPFLRAVFVTGSLALNNTRKDSDYDVLLVAAPGRIFTVRAFAAFFLKMLGVYRSDACVADHVCPNHYVTEQSLAIPFRSLYTAHIFATCVCVWSIDTGMAERFLRENSWIGEYWQNVTVLLQESPRTIRDAWYAKRVRRMFELVLRTPPGSLFEKTMRALQLAKIRANPKTKSPGAGHIVANDEMLAFHPNSPEKGTLEKYKKNLALQGIGLLDS